MILINISCGSSINKTILKDYENFNQRYNYYQEILENQGDIDLFKAEYMMNRHLDLKKLYSTLKDHPCNNVGLKVINANLCLFYEDYNTAIEILNDILDSYPKHLEASFLREKGLELVSLDKSRDVEDITNSVYMLTKAKIFRELFFPEKSIDLLRELLAKNQETEIWYEFGKSIIYYLYLGNEFYPIENEPVLNDIIEKIKSSGITMYKGGKVYENSERDCSVIYMEIMQSVAEDEKFLETEFTDNDREKIEQLLELEAAKPPEEYMNLKIFHQGNRLGIINLDKCIIDRDKYFASRYISQIYTLKRDVGMRFYDLAKLAYKCDIYNKNNPIENNLSDQEIVLNMMDLFAALQKNYLEIDAWNGPYIGLLNRNLWGWNYIFHENLESKRFGIISSGPNSKIDSLDSMKGDDIAFFIGFK